jgi:hypothetical protein
MLDKQTIIKLLRIWQKLKRKLLTMNNSFGEKLQEIKDF